MTDHDWTPRLSADGQFYCSPACGGGHFCRKEWHDKAVEAADALCARLGDGWKPHVWENLGWHYHVSKGVATIYQSGKGEDAAFSAWIEPGVIQDRAIQIIATADTPEDALGFATQDARTLASRIAEVLSQINDSFPTP